MEKNTKPKENVEPSPKEESLNEVAEKAYFFHPVQLSEKSGEILDEQEIEKSNIEIEQKMQEFLKSISEETLQLSEFLIEESKLMNELCMSFKQILKKLNISFNVPPQKIPFRKNIRKAILNEEGHLILFYEKGEVNSAALSEYPPEIVMSVLWVVMPELAKVVMLYRKKINMRVNFFGKVKKELKNVAKAIAGKEGAPEAQNEQSMDVVNDSINSEKQS